MAEEAYARPEQEEATMARRMVRQVTSKRQVTIPKEFCEAVGIDNLVEIVLDDESKTIVMRPYDADNWHIAEHIIEDLVAEGVPPAKLAAAFSRRKAEIEAAIHQVCAEAGSELKKNPNAGRDYLAERLKGMEQK